MMLTDLAAACRKSGLKVVEVAGWQTRGHGHLYAVETIVAHHTATPRTAAGDYPSLGIVRDGRPGLPGPLSQLGLGCDGTVYVIAAGVAYHAGETWRREQDNWHAIGIEAEHDGYAPWPAAQYDAYVRLCRALCDHYGLDASRVQGHKEIAKPAGRKPDPTFDMDAFRARIREDDDMPTPEETRAIVREEIDRAIPKIAKAVMDSDVISRLDVSVREALRDVVDKSAARAAKKEN